MSAACKWLDIAKAVAGIATDYRLAKVLGTNTQRISAYRSGASKTMDDEVAMKLAELAETPPAVVLAELAADRAKSPEARSAWLSLAKVAKQAA